VWTAPLEAAAIIGLLLSLTGVYGLPALGVVLVVLPLQYFFGYKIASYKSQIVEVADARVQRMHEILLAIKLVKFYVWERSFAKQVEEVSGAGAGQGAARCGTGRPLAGRALRAGAGAGRSRELPAAVTPLPPAHPPSAGAQAGDGAAGQGRRHQDAQPVPGVRRAAHDRPGHLRRLLVRQGQAGRLALLRGAVALQHPALPPGGAAQGAARRVG
jgi:hypothetical protein